MIGFIDGYDFKEMEPQKYWAPPSSWSDEKKKETTRNRIFSGEWIGSEKKDGYFAKLVKDDEGNIMLFSRSRNVKGEFPDKHEWVPQLNSFFEALPNGTCMLGELYLPSKPGSSNITTLLGCLKDKCIARQQKNEYLHFYVFDVLALNGKNMINTPIIERIAALTAQKSNNEYVHFATYYSGKELWAKLQEILANGGEGCVIIRSDSHYQPGKRPSKECQKVKKELADTIDCFFTGRYTSPTRAYTGKELQNWKYWVDVRTNEKKEGEYYEDYMVGASIEPVTKPYFYGWAGSLEIAVMKDGKPHTIGFLSGLTDEIKANPAAVANKCIEVAAMEKLSTGGIRHGKMKNFREDLSPSDCTWDKYMGV